MLLPQTKETPRRAFRDSLVDAMSQRAKISKLAFSDETASEPLTSADGGANMPVAYSVPNYAPERVHPAQLC